MEKQVVAFLKKAPQKTFVPKPVLAKPPGPQDKKSFVGPPDAQSFSTEKRPLAFSELDLGPGDAIAPRHHE
jgi:hypothetical protein